MGFKRPPQIRGLLRAGSREVQAAQRSYKGERVGKKLYIVILCILIRAVRVADSVADCDAVRARRLSSCARFAVGGFLACRRHASQGHERYSGQHSLIALVLHHRHQYTPQGCTLLTCLPLSLSCH